MEVKDENPYKAPESDVGNVRSNDNIEIKSRLYEMSDDEIKKLNKFSSDINLLGTASVLMVIGATSLIYQGIAIDNEMPIWAIVGFIIFCVNAYACFMRPSWGRAVGIISSLVLLPGIPIGTVVGYIGINATTDGALLYGEERILGSELGEAIARIESQSA